MKLKPFTLEEWKNLGHPNCYLEDGREIIIDNVGFFGGEIESIFYRFKRYDGCLYLDKGPNDIFMGDTNET